MTRGAVDRFAGCLLGGAVGDALGAPVEFLSLDEIRRAHGSEGIRDMAEAYGRVAAITDDTQMTLFTAAGLLRAVTRMHARGASDPLDVIYFSYLRWLNTQGGGVHRGPSPPAWLEFLPELRARRAPGKSCITALASGRMGTLADPINDSKGCGGVMRIAPVGMIVRQDLAFIMGCQVAAMTHGHPTGILAAGAMALLVRLLMDGEELGPALDRVEEELAPQPQGGETLDALRRARQLAAAGSPSAEQVERLGQGWIAEEALAIAVYASLAADGDFERGVVLAVNHGGDSDSTGAIAGNILGALLGVEAIPERWLEPLELRNEIAELAADMRREYGDDEAWYAKYPPS